MQPVVTYTYDRRRYAIDVLLPTYVSVVVLAISMVLLIVGVLRPLMALLFIVCAYSVVNSFLTHAYPRVVTFDGSDLTLESFGRVDSYPAESIRTISVRETPQGLKQYVRINGGGVAGGRFFLSCADMHDEQGNDARDVYTYLLDTENRLHPDNLRVQARVRREQEMFPPEPKPMSKKQAKRLTRAHVPVKE